MSVSLVCFVLYFFLFMEDMLKGVGIFIIPNLAVVYLQWLHDMLHAKICYFLVI